MSEWIEYTGSDGQYSAIINARNGFILRDKFSKFVSPIFRKLDKEAVLSGTEYLICQPHPYADLIKIWADTGCPVWVKVTKRNDWSRYIDGVYYKPRAMVHEYLEPTTKPDWNIPGAEYRLTPFED